MIYFICGLNYREFKYFEILDKIRTENKGIKEFFFDIDTKEEEKFLDKININSIFSTKELIVLKRAEKIKGIEKFLDYIGNLNILNKEIVIDYFKEDGKLGVKLTKKLEELKLNGKIEVYEFLKKDDSYISEYVKNKLEISQKDVEKLLEMIGNNPFKVKNEIEKIKIFLGEDKFNFEKIKNIISIEKEFKIYEMVDKILMNNIAEVLDYLEISKEYMGILYGLYLDLELMYKLSSLVKSKLILDINNYNMFKIEFEELKEIFKVNGKIQNPYAVFKKLEKTKYYSNKNLRKLVYRCWEIERDIKIGKIELEIGVQSLIMEITSKFKK